MDNPHNGIVDFLKFGRPVNLNYEATLVMTMDNQASARAYPDHIDHYMKTGLGHFWSLLPSSQWGKHISVSPHRLPTPVIMDLS